MNEIGLAFSFRAFKQEIESILDGLDRRNLYETYSVDECTPSTKNFARLI